MITARGHKVRVNVLWRLCADFDCVKSRMLDPAWYVVPDEQSNRLEHPVQAASGESRPVFRILECFKVEVWLTSFLRTRFC